MFSMPYFKNHYNTFEKLALKQLPKAVKEVKEISFMTVETTNILGFTDR